VANGVGDAVVPGDGRKDGAQGGFVLEVQGFAAACGDIVPVFVPPGLEDGGEVHFPGAADTLLDPGLDEGVKGHGVEAGIGGTDGIQSGEVVGKVF
jgi:hypothetical protein